MTEQKLLPSKPDILLLYNSQFPEENSQTTQDFVKFEFDVITISHDFEMSVISELLDKLNFVDAVYLVTGDYQNDNEGVIEPLQLVFVGAAKLIGLPVYCSHVIPEEYIYLFNNYCYPKEVNNFVEKYIYRGCTFRLVHHARLWEIQIIEGANQVIFTSSSPFKNDVIAKAKEYIDDYEF